MLTGRRPLTFRRSNGRGRAFKSAFDGFSVLKPFIFIIHNDGNPFIIAHYAL